MAASHDLVRNLTLRELRSKYRRTVLGQGWSLLNPIAQIALYSIVFSYVLRVQPPEGAGLDVFALWLSAALLPWIFFATVVTQGLSALVVNANLIKKLYFPREALLWSALFSTLVGFLIELSVLHIAVIIFGGRINPLLVPVTLLLVVLLSMFALGIGLVLAVANVYFRDTQHLATLFLQAWFFASAIMYPESILASRLGGDSMGFRLFRLNPIERFGEAFRDTIYQAQMPSLATLGGLTLAAVLSLFVGHAVFRMREGRLAEEL